MYNLILELSKSLTPMMIYTLTLPFVIFHIGDKVFKCIMYKVDRNFLRQEKTHNKMIEVLETVIDNQKTSELKQEKVLYQLDNINKKIEDL